MHSQSHVERLDAVILNLFNLIFVLKVKCYRTQKAQDSLSHKPITLIKVAP